MTRPFQGYWTRKGIPRFHLNLLLNSHGAVWHAEIFAVKQFQVQYPESRRYQAASVYKGIKPPIIKTHPENDVSLSLYMFLYIIKTIS